MTALFHVFIERPRSTAVGAGAQLARTIAARYGLAAVDLEARIAAGRFRVKGNVDRATADAFAADLIQLGAECTILSAEAPAAEAVKATPVTLDQPRVVPPKPSAPVAAPRPAPPPSRPAAAAVTAAPAFHPGDDDDGGLGALSGAMTLSMLDGGDDLSVDRSGERSTGAMLPASFGPPPEASHDLRTGSDRDSAPPSRGSAREIPLAASSGPSAPAGPAFGGGPVDPFAPPDAGVESELRLEVDTPRKAKGGAMAPAPAPAPPPVSEPGPASRQGGARGTANDHGAATSAAAAAPRPTPSPGLVDLARDPRARFVAGVVLAAIIGFIPAALIASVRERSAFADLDSELDRRQNQFTDRAEWDALDTLRASFVERKQAERQSVALTSLVLWAAISGGFAWFWFRKLDWDRLVGPGP